MKERTIWVCAYLPKEKGAGVERFVLLLHDALSKRGRTVRVVDIASTASKAGVSKRFRYLVAWRVGRIVNRLSDPNDVIVCNNFFSWNARRGRSIVIYHGTEGGRAANTKSTMGIVKSAIIGTIGAYLDKRAGKGRSVVAVSEATRQEIEQLYRLKVRAVVPNAVDLSLFKPGGDKPALRDKLGLPRDKFLILFVGTADPRKGLGWIFEDILPRLKGDQHLVVRADVKNPPARATVVGRLSMEDLADLYRACDALLFPTKYEGCSFTLVEALASGLPVVTSEAGSGVDLLDIRELRPYVLKGIEADKYIECLNKLTQSEEEWGKVSSAARAFAENHYSLDKFERTYLELISEVEQHGNSIAR